MHLRTRGSTPIDRSEQAIAPDSPPRGDDDAQRPGEAAETFEQGHARRGRRLNELIEASRRTIEESRLLRALFKKVG